jgi:hypothetical protein
VFLILKTLFTFFTKQANLMRRSAVLSRPLQLVFPVQAHKMKLGFNLEKKVKESYFETWGKKTLLHIDLIFWGRIHNTLFSSFDYK